MKECGGGLINPVGGVVFSRLFIEWELLKFGYDMGDIEEDGH